MHDSFFLRYLLVCMIIIGFETPLILYVNYSFNNASSEAVMVSRKGVLSSRQAPILHCIKTGLPFQNLNQSYCSHHVSQCDVEKDSSSECEDPGRVLCPLVPQYSASQHSHVAQQGREQAEECQSPYRPTCSQQQGQIT